MTQKDEKTGAQDEARRKAEARAKALRANLRRRKDAAKAAEKPAAPQLGTRTHG